MVLHLDGSVNNTLGRASMENTMAKSMKIGRDAGSGKFITVKDAQRRPTTTVVETIKRPSPSAPKKK